jgi:hypothetical protein
MNNETLATQSTEAKIVDLKDILFNVEIKDNPRSSNREYCRVVTATIDNEEMDLNYCSPRYELVDNNEIFPKIETILNNTKVRYEVEYKHINHVRFYASYKITDKRFAHVMKGTNDNIMPIINVRHSYNGQTKYAIQFGYFRLICSNGLVIPVEEMKEHNLNIVGKHTASIVGSIDKLKTTLKNFTSNKNDVVTKIIYKYQILADTIVFNAKERIENVLKANGIPAVEYSNRNTVKDILSRIKVESDDKDLGYNGQSNDWLIYNGINSYLNDDNLNITSPETRREKDSKVFEYMLTR